MRQGERIPLHDHVDRNSGGKLDGGSIIGLVGGAGALGGGGGGGGTTTTTTSGRPPFNYVIAASDTAPALQAIADAVCDGTADEVEIKAAIDACTASGVPYTIKLLDGTYVPSAGVDFRGWTVRSGIQTTFDAEGTTFIAGASMTTMIRLDPGAGGQMVTSFKFKFGKLDGNAASYSVGSAFNLARFSDNSIDYENIYNFTGDAFTGSQAGVSDYPAGNNRITGEIIHNCLGWALRATGGTNAMGFTGATFTCGEIIANGGAVKLGTAANQNATYNTFNIGVSEHNGTGIEDNCGGNTFNVGNQNTNTVEMTGPAGMNLRSTYRLHIDSGSMGTIAAAVLDQHNVQINGAQYGRAFMAEKATTPTTPPSGFADIYPKSDNHLYFLNDAGTETQLDAGFGTGFATPAIVLGTAAAAGAATTGIRSDSTIVAFDATSPTTQALGDSAATGSAAVAARRDHKHAMPALSSATPLVAAGSGAVGSALPSSREDHVHPAAAGSGSGPLLLSDSAGSPVVFGDILQNEAQTDLMYADV